MIIKNMAQLQIANIHCEVLVLLLGIRLCSQVNLGNFL